MSCIDRVKKISKTTERFAKGVLTGVITATNFVSVSAIKSKAGKKLFKMLPGEVALVSLDAFGKKDSFLQDFCYFCHLKENKFLNQVRLLTSLPIKRGKTNCFILFLNRGSISIFRD